MTRDEARQLLPVYADGELDVQRSIEIERCLDESPELRAELEAWQALRRCAQRVTTTERASDGLRKSVLANLEAARPRAALRFHPLRWTGGIAAIAAAVAVIFFLWQPQPVTAQPAEVAADKFMEIYRYCAVQHRHNGMNIDVSDFNTARAQLAGMTNGTALAPDLRDKGFHIGGACRCFQSDGVKAVHVFYNRAAPDPAVISIFTVDRKIHVKNCRCERCVCSSGVCREYETVRDKDLLVYKWDEQGGSYAICSELPPEELRHLADSVTVAKIRAALDAVASAADVDDEP